MFIKITERVGYTHLIARQTFNLSFLQSRHNITHRAQIDDFWVGIAKVEAE